MHLALDHTLAMRFLLILAMALMAMMTLPMTASASASAVPSLADFSDADLSSLAASSSSVVSSPFVRFNITIENHTPYALRPLSGALFNWGGYGSAFYADLPPRANSYFYLNSSPSNGSVIHGSLSLAILNPNPAAPNAPNIGLIYYVFDSSHSSQLCDGGFLDLSQGAFSMATYCAPASHGVIQGTWSIQTGMKHDQGAAPRAFVVNFGDGSRKPTVKKVSFN